MARIKELLGELYGDQAAERTRALIVDDEPAVRRGISRGLRGNSIGMPTTVEADRPSRAIEDLIRDEFRSSIALIVSDFSMPGGMNGIQFASHVREVLRETRIPFVLCSGGGAKESEIKEAISSGHIDVLLAKPFEPEELVSAVEKAIERRLELVRAEQGVAASAEQGSSAGSGYGDAVTIPGQGSERQ